MRSIILILISFISLSGFGQTEKKYIRSGNQLYEDKKYADAELSYRKALDKKSNSFESAFNIGNSLYKEGKFPEAATQFGKLTEATTDKELLSKVYHNLGNSYVKAQKLQEGIDAYKKALIQNPSDQDTKYNLAYVQKLLKQQQQQKKDDKDKNKDQQKKNKDNKDDKDKQKQDQQKKQDQQNKQDQQQNQQKQNQQQQGKQISPQDAQRMLDAVQNDEKKLQKKLEEQKASGEKVKVLKNW